MLQKIIGQNQKSAQLTFRNVYNAKLAKPYRKFTDYEFEKFEYAKQCKNFRKQHTSAHLERQALIENDFIEKYNAEQIQKEKNQEVKFRTSICKIASATQQRMDDVRKKSEKKNDKLKKYMLEQDINKMNRRKIVQMLNQESQNWYNQENLDKLKDESLIPNYVYDQTDYYLKLHEEALLYSIGDFDGLEDLQSENKYVKYKNKLLMPVYQEIVSLVKHMKNTSISKLEKEHEVAKAIVNKQYSDFSLIEEKQNQLDLLQKSFSVLYKKAESDLNKNQIPFLEEHTLMLYNLLDLWEQYTTIIKMSNSVAEQLLKQEKSRFEVYQSENKDNAKTFEESLKSASENETTENEDEIDLTSHLNDQKDAKQAMEQMKDVLKDNQQQNQNVDEFDSILSGLEQQNETEKFDKQFDEQWSRQQVKQVSDFSLGQGEHRIEDAHKLYQGIDLQNIFPRSLINSITDYKPTLKHSSLDQIKNYEEGNQILLQDLKDSNKKLNTSVICQVYQDRIQTLKQENANNKKNLHKLQEIEGLLTLISEQTIQEPSFLLKVWNTY